ncbi:MAG: hypothetical protein ACXV76_10295 [Halobacteriota archaeon]
MDYKALLTLIAALVILFTATFDPVLAFSIAIGCVLVWCIYLLIMLKQNRITP